MAQVSLVNDAWKYKAVFEEIFTQVGHFIHMNISEIHMFTSFNMSWAAEALVKLLSCQESGKGAFSM